MVNDKITAKTVRLIGAGGENLGVMPTADALNVARDKGLDLVAVSPAACPPVCRVMDYGKWRYEKEQREKAAKRQQKAAAEVKEIRMSLSIDAHDMETKAAAARKFLAKGNKVKAIVRFRGRELAHKDQGRQVLDRFISLLGASAKVDGVPKMEGRFLYAFFRGA